MKNPKVMFAMPIAKGDIPQETFNSLLSLNFEGAIRTLSGSLIDDARDAFARDAIKDGFDYILFVDSDMVFAEDTLDQLLADDKDIVSGIFFKRVPPYTPTIHCVDGGIAIDYPRDTLFECGACGMAYTLIKVSALKEVMDEFGTCFQRAYPLGEDLSFCKRWKALEMKTGKPHKIFCDSRVKIGHIGTMIVGEQTFDAYRKKLENDSRHTKK